MSRDYTQLVLSLLIVLFGGFLLLILFDTFSIKEASIFIALLSSILSFIYSMKQERETNSQFDQDSDLNPNFTPQPGEELEFIDRLIEEINISNPQRAQKLILQLMRVSRQHSRTLKIDELTKETRIQRLLNSISLGSE